MMRAVFAGAGWALTVFVVEHCAICTSAVGLRGLSQRESRIAEEVDEPLVVIPPECKQRMSLAQLYKMSIGRRAAQPFAPAPAAAVVAAPAVAFPVAPAAVPVAPTAPAAAPPPSPPPAAATDCADMMKKWIKQQKKAQEKAEEKAKKRCDNACKAAEKVRKKAEDEAKEAAEKGAAAIKEQVARVKQEAAAETKAEVALVKAAIQAAGNESRKELAAATQESLVSGNETARHAIQGLGDKVLEEDKEMFEKAKEHETKLAEKVIKLVWKEGLQSGYDSSKKMSALAGEKAHNTSQEETLPAWVQALHDAEHAKNMSYDSLHSILTMWQSSVTGSQMEWSKVSTAFTSANMAARLSHDTVAQVLSSLELAKLLRDTSTFYKLDANEAYDRSMALLNKANADYALTQRNKGLIAGLEEATADASGVATRAVDAAKKISQEIQKQSEK